MYDVTLLYLLVRHSIVLFRQAAALLNPLAITYPRVHSRVSLRYHVLPGSSRLSYIFTGLTCESGSRRGALVTSVCHLAFSYEEFQFYVGNTFDRDATTTLTVKISRNRRASKCSRKSIKVRMGGREGTMLGAANLARRFRE